MRTSRRARYPGKHSCPQKGTPGLPCGGWGTPGLELRAHVFICEPKPSNADTPGAGAQPRPRARRGVRQAPSLRLAAALGFPPSSRRPGALTKSCPRRSPSLAPTRRRRQQPLRGGETQEAHTPVGWRPSPELHAPVQGRRPLAGGPLRSRPARATGHMAHGRLTPAPPAGGGGGGISARAASQRQRGTRRARKLGEAAGSRGYN